MFEFIANNFALKRSIGNHKPTLYFLSDEGLQTGPIVQKSMSIIDGKICSGGHNLQISNKKWVY
jgi:hypothetical protein